MGWIGAVCGLKSEAALLSPLADAGLLKVAISGASTKRAEQAAERLANDGAEYLLSFGLCGALSADIHAGDLVLADEVCAENDPAARWSCDHERLERLRITLPAALAKRCHAGRLLGSDRIVASADDKQRLGQRYAALAVDMESHAVARVAARQGLAFLVLRACSDEADQELPPAALKATQADGSVDITAVLGGLTKRPGQLSGLVALGKSSKRAHASLARAIKTSASALTDLQR